ncbi:hypothetical protein PHIM7_264 [Sinorhizobium phage phiM7]|uniref:Transmembrane protein n=2 Tax=Emdodecavirus TaxID=1980937 RepID=S5M7F4_9CAUD|nr:hypothetical protein AB690_gp245 [Sinorhizobium phage phiM12]YP_009601389.1 hypothetical protein FDH46_gp214 [Sinorhizobium phage phiM7]AGR47981.1 hypothetical protein SmphiM12_349 [Sinorhizobium phage phiM12]AKF12809.1 hypothetical protein PHIM7_264 [Sinorhizobium phage phiM7]AKF13169.1 hypothetical protein PHIM19_264 [Sinorhizobium phage phiM19]
MEILIWIALGLMASVCFHCFVAMIEDRPFDEFIPARTLITVVICCVFGPLAMIFVGMMLVGLAIMFLLSSATMTKRYRLRRRK